MYLINTAWLGFSIFFMNQIWQFLSLKKFVHFIWNPWCIKITIKLFIISLYYSLNGYSFCGDDSFSFWILELWTELFPPQSFKALTLIVMILEDGAFGRHLALFRSSHEVMKVGPLRWDRCPYKKTQQGACLLSFSIPCGDEVRK